MATERSSPWPLLAWFVLLLAGLAAFHRLGVGRLAGPPLSPASWESWAAARDPLVAIVALLRVGVLGVAWYLVGVTTIGLAARLSRAGWIVAVTDRITVPVVRRLLHGALGLTMATAVATSVPWPVSFRSVEPAWAVADVRADGSSGRPMAPAGARHGHEASVTADPLPSLRPIPRDGELVLPLRHRAAARSATAGSAHSPRYDVRSGDSFWTIASAQLEAHAGREVSDAEIVAYWRTLIDANRDRLADPHNPDLLFPGQSLRLPWPPVGPAVSGVSP